MPKLPKSPPIPADPAKNEWASLGIKGYIMLMLEFLRISPSYALAHEIKTQKLSKRTYQARLVKLYTTKTKPSLTASEKQQLFDDFERVLATYDVYGDIYQISFEDWWLNTGLAIYGVDHQKPQVRQIALIDEHEQIEPQNHHVLDDYFNKPRMLEGLPPALLLSVPLNMNKKYLLTQVSKLIDRNIQRRPNHPPQKAYKRLAAKRLRSEPLFKMLRLFMYKACYADMEQWRIAVKINLSPTYSQSLNEHSKQSSLNTADRYNLNVLTTRMLAKAKYCAEHAARDVFPKFTQRLLPEFDYALVYQRLKLANPKLKPRQTKSKSN